jgi:hypothetical protein
MSVQREFNAQIIEYLKKGSAKTKQIADDFGIGLDAARNRLQRAFEKGVIGRYLESSGMKHAGIVAVWTPLDGGTEAHMKLLRTLPRDPFAHMVARLA